MLADLLGGRLFIVLLLLFIKGLLTVLPLLSEFMPGSICWIFFKVLDEEDWTKLEFCRESSSLAILKSIFS